MVIDVRGRVYRRRGRGDRHRRAGELGEEEEGVCLPHGNTDSVLGSIKLSCGLLGGLLGGLLRGLHVQVSPDEFFLHPFLFLLLFSVFNFCFKFRFELFSILQVLLILIHTKINPGYCKVLSGVFANLM